MEALPLFESDAPSGGIDVAGAEIVNGVPRIRGEFWTARQRQGHRIHEISYRACFKPQLPAFFIQRFTRPGDVVHDPFMGRGTTLVEAALRHRIPYGNDVNPLSRVFTQPRLNTPRLHEVGARLDGIPWDTFTDIEEEELLVFFHRRTLAQIEGLRSRFLEKEGELDNVDAWIRMVALSRLTGHAPGFFSVFTMPPNQAVSVERQKQINRKRNQKPEFRDVPSRIYRKSRSLLGDGGVNASDSLLLTGPSDSTPDIEDESVALTVTSPPFLDVVNYKQDNWLRCWFLGLDSSDIGIAHYRRLEDWERFIGSTLRELTRITRPEGYIAFEVGEVRSGSIRLEDNVISCAAGLPVKPECVLINEQAFTKTANCWGVSNNRSGTNSNRIVLFRKRK